MTSITRGTKIRMNRDGDVKTVKCLVKTYETERARYNGDTNPHPAGTMVCDFEGGGLNRGTLRPGSFTVIG